MTSQGDYASESISGRVTAASVIGLVLPSIAVAIRLSARHLQGLRMHVDDFFIMIALALKFGVDIGGFLLVRNGLGRHITTVSPENLVVFFQVQFSGSILYPFCVTFIKLAILWQYRRLFSARWFRYFVDYTIVILILWTIAVSFTGIFMCSPIDKAWYPAKPGHCINLEGFYYGLQIPNVATDFAILVLPLKEVMELHLPRQQKIGVALTFALWLLTLIFDIVRLVVMIQLKSKGSDATWNLVAPAIWTSVEPTVALVTACLPSFRVFYRALHTRAMQKKNEKNDALRNGSDGLCGSAPDDTTLAASRLSHVATKSDKDCTEVSLGTVQSHELSDFPDFEARKPSEQI